MGLYLVLGPSSFADNAWRPFFGKPLAQLILADLERLIADGINENLHLEYKRELHLDEKDQKKEYLRGLTAFANSDGGIIFFGIDEERDADEGKYIGHS